jgi:EAL domain-containing protein (putative c-di-GMP-specific phosphodiesterase class I)
VGATLFGGKSQGAAEVLKQADIAMYQAKAQRGNRLCFFDPGMQEAINERVQLEADLQVAMAEQQFSLYLQPQCTCDGALVGAEALLRWQHPRRGLVLPGEFIGVAEESELVVPIGRWVLGAACALLARWEGVPHLRGLSLSVNVSARQFRQPDFVEQVAQALQQTGARAHLLELELTESLVLEDVDDTIDKMHQLRTKGVRFSVDDFGAGYSSLAYLTRLPLHRLKIDQSFARNLGVRPTDDVVVQTILGMARNLELEVVAEGVETEAQLGFLALHGCDLYQGYLFGRPMPVEALEALAAPELAVEE